MVSLKPRHESQLEAESRKAANYPDVEKSLFEKFSADEMSYVAKVTSKLPMHLQY